MEITFWGVLLVCVTTQQKDDLMFVETGSVSFVAK